PFALLGLHERERPGTAPAVRAFVPGADGVAVIDRDSGAELTQLARVHEDGLFAGEVPGRGGRFVYKLRIRRDRHTHDIEDPYRFGLVLQPVDVHLLCEGTHLNAYRVLGAHCRTMEGVAGVSFAVWAPNARRVSVVGEFNGWDGRVHVMRFRPECGIW